ncbi:MAG: putative lipase/esterase [Microbacteriaceae bacterium]|nr:putative lipase/esterase [Microbacteriaceae bacterium]
MTDTAPLGNAGTLASDLTFRPATVTEAAAGAARPLVLVLPGGGYVRHADHEGTAILDWLAGLGLNALMLHYPVAPARHPAALLRAQEVISAVRSGALDLGPTVDRSMVGVIGFSAGGHLAAELSTAVASVGDDSAPRVDLAVLGYPVISMVHEPHTGSLESLVGADSAPDLRRLLSQELRVTADTPPTFLWHTTEDDAVPVSHSLRYASALAEHDVPFELHVFERGGHGTGLGRGKGPLEAWPELCAAWLRLRGWAL